MCKSLLYCSNTNSQAVTTGDTIDFGKMIRRTGQSIKLDGGNIVVEGIGYYTQSINISFTALASGNQTFTVYKDGAAVPGASGTMSVVADGLYNVVIPCVIRSQCCCESTIVVVASGVNITISNAAVEVIKE